MVLVKVCSAEPELTRLHKAQLEQMYNTWMNTSVFSLACQYLQQKAFEFSLLTVCALKHPGEEGYQYSIGRYSLGITTYTQPCDAGTCLSTAYPTN
ncbi:hypothetical protein KIN20_008376 [Parelaphostrongylus tenuis]|uniref:Uncharacterized protein n=1 Tax=Parelaphostrongylus tenuis TaxID=148309 RepID=A0AAD5M4R7_PARTN|nr:hypothetical protein KIN20_008376 [Parelaphostrongylus tenuis]